MFNRLNTEHWADRAREVYDESRDMATRGAHEANSFIHRSPVAATLLALGTGLIMGVIFPRHTKPSPAVHRTRRPSGATATRKRSKA